MQKKMNAVAVAHGSTGAGNDQVRFDMIFNIMIPGIEIITPIRDLQLSREAEIEYLKAKGVSNEF
jgi:argininosuccinate synthase